MFVSGKRKDARPKHFKLGKTVNSYGTKLSKKHNNCSLQNCLKTYSIEENCLNCKALSTGKTSSISI